MAIGHPVYMTFTPNTGPPQYNIRGARPNLEGVAPNIPKELPMQPQYYYDNRLSPASFMLANIQKAGYTVAELYPYPVANENLYFAPPEPIRYDTYRQLAARAAKGVNVAGTAPTAGVYTGLPDLSFERL